MSDSNGVVGGVEVETPTGGHLMLRDAAEAEMYDGLRDRYIRDFALTKQNDLVQLTVLLQQAVILERAQKDLNGMEPELDEDGEPTGRWVEKEMTDAQIDKAHSRVIKASEQITAIEVKLGIDRKSREQGADSVADYLSTVKRATNRYAIHIAKRVKMYEALMMELRWRIRLLRNGDAEDRAYHKVTPENIIDLAEAGLARIEEHDKKYASEVGKVFIGKI